MASLAPLCTIGRRSIARPLSYADRDNLVLSDFSGDEPYVMTGAR